MAATPEADPKPWRLFVAVELPGAVRDALRQPIAALTPLSEWRTSPPEQIHLTLHFLGGVDVDRIAQILGALGVATQAHQRFELGVRGVGAFGGTRRPQVLWAGFEERGVEALKGLRRDTASALTQCGFEIDPDFKPHLTLARARRPIDGRGREALRAWYDAWKDRDFGVLPVTSVQLMRSQLGGGPARHSTVASRELQ